MNNTQLLTRYQGVITGSQAPEPRDQRLLMASDGDLKVYYAPFEYVNASARIALVGITPGPTQMRNALTEARRVLLSGGTPAEALRLAKDKASFSGEPMRSNLVKQLNDWGVHQWLGLTDSKDLFGSAASLVHYTSLLRYPVFNGDEDYRGNPDMLSQRTLDRFLRENFVQEVNQLKDAVFLSLGPAVARVLNALIDRGVLEPHRVISGMLHPSPNCTYRINYLVGDRTSPIPHATNPQPYDHGRQWFQARHLRAG